MTAKEHPGKKGRPSADDAEAAMVEAAKAKADEVKNSAYALGKAPEHLTENQQAKVAMIAENNNRPYRAYCMKEMLRLLLKMRDVRAWETTVSVMILLECGVAWNGVTEWNIPIKKILSMRKEGHICFCIIMCRKPQTMKKRFQKN